MGIPGLVLAFLLSAAAGVAIVGMLFRHDWRTHRALIAGYGIATGLVLTTLATRAAFALGWGLAFPAAAGALLILTAAGAGIGWFAAAGIAPQRRPALVAPAGPPIATRVLAWLFVTLAGVRVVSVGLETWWRPLFPWDAWEIWGPKTKIWFLARDLNNFYGHFDNGYPPGINLLQIWANLGMGAWDDARMNLAWPLMLAALALAGYGQVRALGGSVLAAAILAWLLVSLPMLDTHAALAGYADLPLAVMLALAAFAFIGWTLSGDNRQLALAIVVALTPPLFKIPGLLWSLALVPAFLFAVYVRHRHVGWVRWGLPAGTLALGALAAVVAAKRNFSLTQYQAHLAPNATTSYLADNFLWLGNYHLLFWLLPVALVLAWREVIGRELRSASLLVGSGLAFLAVSFYFTNTTLWWADYGTINRATIHFAPVLVYYLFLISRASLSRSGTTLGSSAGPGTSPSGG